MNEQELVKKLVRENMDPLTFASEHYNADFIALTGPITRELGSHLLDVLEEVGVRRKENVCVLLSTFGGDGDAAYIIARTLKRFYEHFSLFIYGFCKSAGTIIALGADEIIMSERGELGPLDVQILKEDSLGTFGSGLDVVKSIRGIGNSSFNIFEEFFLEILQRSGGAITTKTAAEVATNITTGLMAPVTAQLDPVKIGEIQRAVDIAFEYGMRLGAKPYTVHHLIHHYPSHAFVIDFDEAHALFPCVREPDILDSLVENQIRKILFDEFGCECVRIPNEDSLAAFLTLPSEEEDETNDNPQQVDGKENKAVTNGRTDDEEFSKDINHQIE